MKILVIGGTVFLGRAIVEEALRRGHEVTTFNRGRSAADVPGVETVRGDREVRADLERLADGRTWDVVVDVFGLVPRVVAESARALSGKAAMYAYVSSVSAIRGFPERPVDEDSPLHEGSPDAGPGEGTYETFKAGSERAVERWFAGEKLILAPGVILGPYENVGRLPTWLNRVRRGGRFVAPGDPGRPLQFIDVRDVAAFLLDRAERGTGDRFLVSSRPGVTTFGELLAECARVTGADAEPVWLNDRFLLEQGVAPWNELPLWAPDQPAFAGVFRLSTEKAHAAGLRCRPVAETVRDTWAWLGEAGGLADAPATNRGAVPRPGIDAAKEARILAAWDAR
ncbi:MAG: NAD-dependent epimerase/dehydratase family protein [Actinomycetes bacterium]|nr:MAG: NAD-dependent epimerase [Actinomycetota bacterium]